MKTNVFHYVKVQRLNRTGRAKRGTDTTAKKYHLTYCGKEVTDRELRDALSEPTCRTCERAAFDL